MINGKYIKLNKPAEFDKRFHEHLNHCDTYIQAYKLTERDYASVFGENKYTSFKSFINSYYRRVHSKIDA